MLAADSAPEAAGMAPHLTALRSLFLLAMHHGCHLSPEQIGQAQSDDLAAGLSSVLRDAGFETRLVARGGWADVAALGSAFPALAE